MTATEERARHDRRPDWLKQKHQQRPADPKLYAWADKVIAILADDRTMPRGLFAADDDTARKWKNAMYEACKRWNRAHPGDEISLSCNLIDPQDGQCKARGAERCSQNDCAATPGRHGIHARVYSKRDGRAHQGAKPRDTWDYDPMISSSGQAGKEPSRAFGAGSGISAGAEDETPSRLRRRVPPADTAGPAEGCRRAKPAASPAANADAQSFAEKLRRWTR